MSRPSTRTARRPMRSPSSTSTPSRSPTRRSSARSTMPNAGDELHHFGWNACSSCLCPNAPHRPCRAALPGRAGPALVAHPHPRHQARSEEPQDRQGHRAGGGRRARPATPGRTPSIADRKASTSTALGNARGQGARRHLPHGPRDASTCAASGRWIAGRSTSPMMSGGISATTPWSPANGARPTPSRTG